MGSYKGRNKKLTLTSSLYKLLKQAFFIAKSELTYDKNLN